MISASPLDSSSSSVRPVHWKPMPGIMFCFGQRFHARERLPGAVAGRRRAVDLDRAEKVVVADDRRSRAFRHGDQVIERNHLAGVGAHVVIVQIAGFHAERLVGLHIHAIGAVVVVEVVDVLRAHEHIERSGDLRDRDTHRFGLLAIDGDQFLRIVGGERGEQIGQILVRGAGADDLVGHAVQVAECVAALVLQHELEASEATHALTAGGWKT